MSQLVTVLFVCVHNAGRSQMAAGYLRHLGGDQIKVISAGTEPGTEINEMAMAVMLEEGIDLSTANPEKLSDQKVLESDYVITMGCGDACPYFPGKTYLDWPLTDPKNQPIEVVREIRNEIKAKVEALIAEVKASS
ncbi:MAG: arsenate reductase ArsC [Rhodoluna sp.]